MSPQLRLEHLFRVDSQREPDLALPDRRQGRPSPGALTRRSRGTACKCSPRRLDSSAQVGSRPALSPDGAVLYMGSFDGSLYALTSHSGQEIWRYPTGSAVHSDPVLSEDGALMASDAR